MLFSCCARKSRTDTFLYRAINRQAELIETNCIRFHDKCRTGINVRHALQFVYIFRFFFSLTFLGGLRCLFIVSLGAFRTWILMQKHIQCDFFLLWHPNSFHSLSAHRQQILLFGPFSAYTFVTEIGEAVVVVFYFLLRYRNPFVWINYAALQCMCVYVYVTRVSVYVI